VAAVETCSLTKRFRARWPLGRHRPVDALQDVTLRVEAGEVFGLLGPNGAGKTTLLKILATLLLPSGGEARVLGADVVRQPALVRRRVALVTGDERACYWRLSGRDNLIFFAGLLGCAPGEARRRAEAALGQVGLTEAADQVVARYSTGMRQRLLLARALLGGPPVLCLDEPTRSLDPQAAEAFRALVRRLASTEGRTVLLATHDFEEAAAVCDRVGILAGGRLREVVAVGDGGAARVRARYEAAVEETRGPALPAVGVSPA